MANLPLSGLPQATTLENNATIVTVQTVGSTVVNQRVPKALFFSQAIAGALIAANNLSDIANAAIALSNLGVHNPFYVSGTTAPANSLGNVGDFAFNDNFEWYEKTAASTWTLRVNAVTTAEMTTAVTTAVTTATTGMLTQTVADTRYAPLGESPGSGARYNFSVSTTLASTASGEIRFSSGTLSSVTSIAIHESDRNGGSMTTILDTIGVGSKLQIAFDASEESYCWFNVTAITDNGSYRTYTVTYLAAGTGAIAAGEVTLGIFGSAPVAASGGATGIQYTYSSTAGTPNAGQIRSANIGVSGTVSISATDAQSQSAADVLARLKVGAIVDIAKDGANQIRGTVTADYSSGANSFTLGSVVAYGTIASGNTVYLSIVSDAPFSGGGGGSVGAILALPFQITDPAPQLNNLLIFARADGLPYVRKPDGTVYPFSLGSSVPPISGAILLFQDTFTAADGTAIIGRTPQTGAAYYKLLAVSTNGSIQSNAATYGGVGAIYAAANIGAYTSYNYTADFICGTAGTGNVQFYVRCGGVNSEQGIFIQMISNTIVFVDATGSGYTTLSNEAFTQPSSGSIAIAVTPASVSVNINAGAYTKTISNSSYTSNTGIGFAVAGTGYSIDNLEVLSS